MNKRDCILNKPIRDLMIYKLQNIETISREIKAYESGLMPCNITQLTGMPHSGKTSDQTADTALTIACDKYLLRKKETEWAIARVINSLNETSNKLITMVYFNKTHSIPTAAEELFIAQSTAYDIINYVLYCIAVNLGEIKNAN